MPSSTLVTFNVRAETNIGVTVCVSGDHAELGAFNVHDSKELTTSTEAYPIWTFSVLLPSGVPRTYKYVKWSYKKFEWENLGQELNRSFTPHGERMVINDEFGVYTAPPMPSAMPTPSPSTAPEPKVAYKRLVLVAFHLPVKLRQVPSSSQPQPGEDEVWEAEWDQDNVAAKTEDSVADDIEVTWIGAVTHANITGDWFWDPSPERRRGIETACKAMNCIPVFLDQSVYTNHYSLFCKKRLWDIFHNVIRPEITDDGSGYDGFVQGNRMFADAVLERLGDSNDIVWVHDYHLMLVPKMLRGKHVGPIVFFLHVPFPTSEIFRTLTVRHELLEGMLSASTIGFHSFNHGRHFLTACRRFLGATSRSCNGGMLAVEHRDRRVLITISHLGVDPKRLDLAQTSEESIQLAKSIRAAGVVPDQVVFASLDEMQRLCGIPLKLLAFERLLATNKRWHNGRARFVAWTMKKGARQEDVTRSTAEVRILVDRINAAYGPVVELKEFPKNQPPTIRQRVGLWLAADVFVSTSVGEGLNLIPLEFMYVRGNRGTSPGAVIISEFSAASSVLNGAVRVNCYDIGSIAKHMDEVATMPLQERVARRARDIDYLTSTASEWTRYIIKEVLTALDDETFTTIGQIRTMGGVSLPHTVQCKPLNVAQVADTYRSTKRRVFLLDFGGTLVAQEQENLTVKRDFLGVSGRGLSEGMKKTLELLCSDNNNLVFIVSGLSRTVLSRVFSDLLEANLPLGIVAHTGLCIRKPAVLGARQRLRIQTHRPEQSSLLADKFSGNFLADAHTASTSIDQSLSEWENTKDFGADETWDSWIQEAGMIPIMKKFTWTTGGSLYTSTPITTKWDYTLSDPEWGHDQANHLVVELEAAIEAHQFPITVKHTKSTVQLLPQDVNKGSAAEKIFSELKTLRPDWTEAPDFCLCLGDDLSDELMFAKVHRFFTFNAPTDAMFTATVGRKPTSAHYYVRDADDVHVLLNALVSPTS